MLNTFSGIFYLVSQSLAATLKRWDLHPDTVHDGPDSPTLLERITYIAA
jgi:hypothetical protein